MIAVLGPYVGSFEYEVKFFRPYIKWVSKNIEFDDLYICTHFNRYFLYNQTIKEDKLLPVYKNLTRDELGQKNHLHNLISLKDYNIIIKKYRDFLSTNNECSKKDIEFFNLKYAKSIPNPPIYKRIFDKINFGNIPEELKNLNIFIPYGDEKESEELYKYIKSIKEDFVVVGEYASPLQNYNIMLDYIDYFENGLKYIIGAITHAKSVICPISYWTILCNIQRSRVFSWGDNPGQYKFDGIYSFNNDKSIIIPNIDNLNGSIKCFVEGL